MDDLEQASSEADAIQAGAFSAFSFAIDEEPPAEHVVDVPDEPALAPVLEPAPEPSGLDTWTYWAAWILIGLGLILVVWAIVANR